MKEIEKDSQESSKRILDFSFANEISVATLVRLLVKKGIFTVDEVVSEEVKTRSKKSDSSQDESRQRKSSRLKRFASRHRWSRQLTASIFGWHWKRVKVRSTSENENEA